MRVNTSFRSCSPCGMPLLHCLACLGIPSQCLAFGIGSGREGLVSRALVVVMADQPDKGLMPPPVGLEYNALPVTTLGTSESGCARSALAHQTPTLDSTADRPTPTGCDRHTITIS
jgi:hypothetical protein